MVAATLSATLTPRLALLAAMLGAVWQSAQAREIQPADVYQNTMVIRAELEEIRKVLGKPRDPRPEIKIRGAAPREVFFQAITLWVKTERLCKEMRRAGIYYATRVEVAPPDNVVPGDVYTLTKNARGRLSCVRRVLELDYHITPPPRDASKTPSDVFRSIVQANRQLNLLLAHRFEPRDVFAVVSLTNDYVRATLDRLSPNRAASAAKLPAYVGGKRPADVFRQLTRCLAVAKRIARRSNLQMLDFEPDFEQSIVPSDVFDIASLVFSEVRYFATKLAVKKRYKVRTITDKVPSDVYQQAVWLEHLLRTFERLVARHPDWQGSP